METTILGFCNAIPMGNAAHLDTPRVLNHSEAVEAGEANATREAVSPISTFTPH